MAYKVFKNASNRLYFFRRPTRWDSNIGQKIPEAYKKFWREWKVQQPAAVHYIEKPGKYEWDDFNQIAKPVQNVPLRLRYPKEIDEGIWGGEAVVQGFRKKNKYERPTAKFWVPRLHKSVVHSEVLNIYLRCIVTLRTLDLIHDNYGFDHYLLKTPACDLRSLLALRLKKRILVALADKTLYPNDPEKREEVYEKYKGYLDAYTREEIEWYGLTWEEALKKYMKEDAAKRIVEPFKVKYRLELINQLKADRNADVPTSQEGNKSWLSKINPFTKSD